MTNYDKKQFIESWKIISYYIHETAKDKGFWDKERNDSEMLMLIVTELAECCEGLRHGNPQSEAIPDYTNAEEELADAIIRIMDMAKGKGWDLSGTILAKMEFNKSREAKHGKIF